MLKTANRKNASPELAGFNCDQVFAVLYVRSRKLRARQPSKEAGAICLS